MADLADQIEQNLNSLEQFQQASPLKRYNWRLRAYRSFGLSPEDAQGALEYYRDADMQAMNDAGTSSLQYYTATPEGQKDALRIGGQFVKEGGLPLAGDVTGRAIGTAASVPLRAVPGGGYVAPFLPPLLAAGGAATGELANQALGIHPFDMGEVAKTGAASLAMETPVTLSRIGRQFGAKKGPELLSQAGYKEAESRIGALSPAKPADFEALKNFSQPIPTPHTVGTIQRVMDDMRVGRSEIVNTKANQDMLAWFATLQQRLMQGGLTPADYQREMQYLNGVLIPGAKAGDPKHFGALKELYRSLNADIARAARQGVPGASDLLEARQSFARQRLVDDMTEALKESYLPQRGQEVRNFNPAAVIRKIEKEEFFEKVLQPQERDELINFLEDLNKAGLLQPPATVNAGSKRIMTKLGTAAGAGAAGGGYALSQDPKDISGSLVTGGIAAGAGLVAPAIYNVYKNLVQAGMTKVGRETIRSIVAGEGAGALWNPKVMSAIGGIAASYENMPYTEQFTLPESAMEETSQLPPQINKIPPPPGAHTDLEAFKARMLSLYQRQGLSPQQAAEHVKEDLKQLQAQQRSNRLADDEG